MNKLRLKKKDFTERLKKIKFKQENHPNFDKFLEIISLDESKTHYVDLTKFQYLLQHHKTMGAAEMLAKDDSKKKELKMDDDTQIYFYNLSEEFSNNINGVINYFDFDNSGDISKLEFVVKSIKLFGREQSKEYEKIFNSLL